MGQDRTFVHDLATVHLHKQVLIYRWIIIKRFIKKLRSDLMFIFLFTLAFLLESEPDLISKN